MDEAGMPSRDATYLADELSELVEDYSTELTELTFNSKPIISNLTIIAGENRQAAPGIADAICRRILQAPSDEKLPCLYLLDSIVKNEGGPYIDLFSERLPEVFLKSYEQVPSTKRRDLLHLFSTWITSSVFPRDLLLSLEERTRVLTARMEQREAVERGMGAPRLGVIGIDRYHANSLPVQETSPGKIHVNPRYLQAHRDRQWQGQEDALPEWDEIEQSTPITDSRPTSTSRHLPQGSTQRRAEIPSLRESGRPAAGPARISGESLQRGRTPGYSFSYANGGNPRVNGEKSERDGQREVMVQADAGRRVKRVARGGASAATASAGGRGRARALGTALGTGRGRGSEGRVPRVGNPEVKSEPLSRTARHAGTSSALARPQRSESSRVVLSGNFPSPAVKARHSSSLSDPPSALHATPTPRRYTQGSHPAALEPSYYRNPAREHRSELGRAEQAPVLPSSGLSSQIQLLLQSLQGQSLPQADAQLHLPLSPPSTVDPVTEQSRSHLLPGPPPDHLYAATTSAEGSSVLQAAPPLPTGPPPVPASVLPPVTDLLSSLLQHGVISSLMPLPGPPPLHPDPVPLALPKPRLSGVASLYEGFPHQCFTCGLRMRQQAEYARHLDNHFEQRAKQRGHKTRSRPWLMPARLWLGSQRGSDGEQGEQGMDSMAGAGSEGAVGAEAGAGAGTGGAEAAAAAAVSELACVPANLLGDESGMRCALCGEELEQFFSQEEEQWMLRGAVVVDRSTLRALPAWGEFPPENAMIVHAVCIPNSGLGPLEVYTRSSDCPPSSVCTFAACRAPVLCGQTPALPDMLVCVCLCVFVSVCLPESVVCAVACVWSVCHACKGALSASIALEELQISLE